MCLLNYGPLAYPFKSDFADEFQTIFNDFTNDKRGHQKHLDVNSCSVGRIIKFFTRCIKSYMIHALRELEAIWCDSDTTEQKRAKWLSILQTFAIKSYESDSADFKLLRNISNNNSLTPNTVLKWTE